MESENNVNSTEGVRMENSVNDNIRDEITIFPTDESTVIDMFDITLDKCGGVMKQILKEGEGDEFPGYGDKVFVHYTGWLLNNKNPVQFDHVPEKDKPCDFNIGKGLVIKGWDLAIASMKKGEVALFIIQPKYAYGDLGSPPTIPPHTPLMFQIELHEWKLEDLSPKQDGSILRKVIEKGEGIICPNEGSVVKVKLVGYYEDKVFEDCEKEFILGEGCCANVVEGVELSLFKFHLKEKSIIHLKSKYGFNEGSEKLAIPPDAAVKYEVLLCSFEKAKDVWEMNTDEKLEKAVLCKEKGISYIKAGNHKVALKQFRLVLVYLENEPGVAPESEKSRKDIILSTYLNVTLCLLKLENFVEAIKFCDKALVIDPENEKAIFRRGQARMHINDCKEALEDFKTIQKLYPHNKAAVHHITLCHEKMKQQSLKDKNVYNEMFAKFKKQDEEKMKSMKTETGVWENDKQDEVERHMTETEKLIERNNSFLREANIIELSNTAF